MTMFTTGRFAAVPAGVFYDTRLNHTDIVVLGAIATFGNASTWCWPSRTRLAQVLGRDLSNVSKSIRNLEQAGWLKVEARVTNNGYRRGSRYCVQIDQELDPSVCRIPLDDEVVESTPDGQPVPIPMAPVAHTYGTQCLPDGQPVPTERDQEKETTRKKRSVPPEPPVVDPRVDELFTHFKTKINQNLRMIRDGGKHVLTALETYSVDDLKLAIDNAAADTWFMANCASRGFDWFFAADQRIERYYAAKAPPPKLDMAGDANWTDEQFERFQKSRSTIDGMKAHLAHREGPTGRQISVPMPPLSPEDAALFAKHGLVDPAAEYVVVPDKS